MSELLRPWDIALVNRYLPTEALSKDREAFLGVHVPIEQIFLDPTKPLGVPYTVESVDGNRELVTDEGRLLAWLQASLPEDPNRIVMLVGETGSGKSELCQWLAYMLERDQRHVPILISRAKVRLADIVGAIEAHLDSVPATPLELEQISPQQFCAAIEFALLQHVDSERGERVFGPNRDNLRTLIASPQFDEVISEKYLRYRDETRNIGGARNPDLLPLDSFSQATTRFRNVPANQRLNLIWRKYPEGVDRVNDYIHAQLEPIVSDAFARLLQVDDLILRVRELSQRMCSQGRRAVLLIEDITTFGFLQNGLLDELFDLSSGHFDVVLGITTDRDRFNQERGLLPESTLSERLSARLLLTREFGAERTTPFADRSYQQLAANHLRAIVNTPDPVPDWWDAFDATYPFQKVTLDRIWRNLYEGGNPKRTPRLLLQTLREVLSSAMPTPEVLDLLSSGQAAGRLSRPRVDVVLPLSADPSLAAVARWYGVPSGDFVYVPRKVLAAFAVGPDGFEQVGDWLLLPLAPALRPMYRGHPAPTATLPDDDDHEDEESEGNEDDAAARERNQREAEARRRAEEIEAARRRVQEEELRRREEAYSALATTRQAMLDWLERGGEFSRREILAKGVITALRFFEIDPFELRDSGVIHRGATPILLRRPENETSRIAFEGIGDYRDIVRLLIRRDRRDQLVLESLLTLGMQADGGVEDLRSRSGSELMPLHDYLQRRAGATRRRGVADLTRQLGRLDIAIVTATAWFLILNAAGRLVTADPRGLLQFPEPEQLPDPPPAQMLGDGWTRLRGHADVFAGLMRANFFFQASFARYDELEECAVLLNDPNAFVRVLDQLQHADPGVLATRYAVARSRSTSFSEAIKALQDYARGLRAWQRQTPAAELRRLAHDNRRLLPAPEEIEALAGEFESIVEFQLSRSRRNVAWDPALVYLRQPDADRDLAELHGWLAEVDTALRQVHPAHLVHAARRLQQIHDHDATAVYREIKRVSDNLTNDATLNSQYDPDSPFRAAFTARRRLEEALG